MNVSERPRWGVSYNKDGSPVYRRVEFEERSFENQMLQSPYEAFNDIERRAHDRARAEEMAASTLKRKIKEIPTPGLWDGVMNFQLSY